MGILNPTLESQVAFEAPVQAPRDYNALTDIAKLATGFTKALPTTTATSADRAVLANFGNELNRARDLKEQGKPFNVALEKSAMAAITSLGKNVPENFQMLYENISGRPFSSIGADDDYMEDKARMDMLASEKGQSLYLAVKASNTDFTNEQIEDEVVSRLSEESFLQAAVDRQKLKASLGIPIEPTPIVESIQNDFNLLALKVKEYQADNIITRDEFLSASTSVKSLIASKYAGMESNEQVKSVIDQMNGLLDDMGKGVSTDPLDIQLDAVQVALSKAGFNAATIAVTRSMIKTNPQSFKDTLLKGFETAEDKTWVDALVKMWDAPEGSKIENIFDTGRPEIKDKIEVLPVPSVSTAKSDDVAAVVENMSKIVSTANPMSLRSGEEARNEWFKATNTLATIVASTGGNVFLGEKLLEMFASKGMRDNLRTLYGLDDANAAQTNGLLQAALASQKNKATAQIETLLAAGDDQYLFMEDDKVVINLEPFRKRVDEGRVSLGRRRLNELERVTKAIRDEAGSLQQFFRLSEERREQILEGSTFEDIFKVRFGDTFRLVETLESIKTKTQALMDLQKRFPAAHDNLDTALFTDKALKTVNEATTSTELGEAPKPVDYTRDNPYVFKEGISEEDAKNIFNNLPIGSVYIDPFDGEPYRKDK